MARRMSRRRLFEVLAGLSFMSAFPRGAAAQAQPKMRVRPGDPAWPSDAAWDELNRQVEGRLIKVRSPLAACVGASTDPACAQVFKELKNPYFLGDEVGLTQSLGWVGAWTSQPSVYAVATKATADVVAAVNFARKNNLYMLDTANYALALKKSDDPNIKETQLTTDGEEFFGYARRVSGAERDQEQQQEGGAATGAAARDKTGRVPPVMIAWSKDSKKFSLVRRDERKVADLWVINTLENPRPTLETYKYAMPGDVNVPQPHMEVFDIAAKSRKEMKIDRFKDEFARVLTTPVTARQRERQRIQRPKRRNHSCHCNGQRQRCPHCAWNHRARHLGPSTRRPAVWIKPRRAHRRHRQYVSQRDQRYRCRHRQRIGALRPVHVVGDRRGVIPAHVVPHRHQNPAQYVRIAQGDMLYGRMRGLACRPVKQREHRKHCKRSQQQHAQRDRAFAHRLHSEQVPKRGQRNQPGADGEAPPTRCQRR